MFLCAHWASSYPFYPPISPSMCITYFTIINMRDPIICVCLAACVTTSQGGIKEGINGPQHHLLIQLCINTGLPWEDEGRSTQQLYIRTARHYTWVVEWTTQHTSTLRKQGTTTPPRYISTSLHQSRGRKASAHHPSTICSMSMHHYYIEYVVCESVICCMWKCQHHIGICGM